MKKKSASPKVIEEDYNIMLAGLEVLNIHVEYLRAKRNNEVGLQGTNLLVNLSLDKNPSYSLVDRHVSIRQKYRLQLSVGDAPIATVEVVFVISAKANAGFDDRFFEVFKERNLTLWTFPYLRELVASVTTRLALPTVTLPPFLVHPSPMPPPTSRDAE